MRQGFLDRFLASLQVRSRPHFGQLTLILLLIGAIPLAGYFECHHGGVHPRGDRVGPVGPLSFLPDAILLDPLVFRGCGILFGVGLILWVLRWGLPWSSWLCAASFYAVVALYLESASQATHVAHLTIHLLFVHALWYHFYAKEIQQADREGRFWTTPLYPAWGHFLGVFSVGAFYGWSGLSKLLESGPDWANGVSLQLWTQLWGNPDSPWTKMILADRRIAQALQLTTLVGETAGFLAIVSRRARPWIGLLLIGFHIGQIAVFGWGFHANMVMLGLFFLPVDRWIDNWLQAREKVAAKETSAQFPGERVSAQG